MNKPRKIDDSEFRQSAAGKQLIALIQDPKTGQVIGQLMAELAIELADAIQEKNHWRASFETVKNEMKILASVLLMHQPDRRLAISRSELTSIPAELELHYETPEDGVRLYALRARHVEKPN